MGRTLKRSKATLPAWAKPTSKPAPLVVSAEPEFAEAKGTVSGLPWRRRLAGWPDEWRERWGRAANALEDQGMAWRDAEERAWVETLKAKREAVEVVAESKPRKSERPLFKESA